MYRQAQLIHNTDYTNNRVTYLKKKKHKNANNIDDSTLPPSIYVVTNIVKAGMYIRLIPKCAELHVTETH